MRQGRLDYPEGGIDVGLYRRVEVLVRDLCNRRARLLAPGVADEDIQPTELAHGLIDQIATEGCIT